MRKGVAVLIYKMCLGTVASIVTLYAVYWHYSAFARLKTSMSDACFDLKFTFENSGNTARIRGRVNGYPIEVTSQEKDKYTRHHHVRVTARMEFVDAPSGFCLRREGVGTGMERLSGKSEIEFGHADFDDAFWVDADDAQALQAYLTRDRREALLHWLMRFGEGSINNGVLEQSSVEALECQDGISRMLSQLVGLAKAFGGEPEYHQATSQLEEGWVATSQVRRCALWTGVLALSFWLLPLEVHLPAWAMELDHGMMMVSLVATVLALAGQRRMVLVLTSLLGMVTSLALVAVAGMMALGNEPLWATGAFLVSVGWILVWSGKVLHLKNLKGAF